MGLGLTRNDGQAVMIGENIEVTVVKATRGRVVLRINAPKDLLILRKELTESQPTSKDCHKE